MKLIFLFLLLLSSLFAHPHTFIEIHPTIEFKNNRTSSIHFKWVLDDMSSSILIMDVDKNGDGVISRSENTFIQKEYFFIFEDYSYYTYIKVDGKLIKPLKAINFKATIENHKLCYSFDVMGNFSAKNTVLEFGDSDFYIAMVLKDKFLNIKGASSTVTGVDNDFYYGYRLDFK